MKISCRKGVFETNSSSIHSISIGQTKEYIPESKPFKDQEVNIPIRDFELGPEILKTPEERAAYLLALAKGYEEFEKWDKKITKKFERAGAKKVNIAGAGQLYSYFNGDKLLRDLDGDSNSVYLDDYLFADNTIILIDSDNADELADKAEELGMGYNLEYRELKRYQYRIQ